MNEATNMWVWGLGRGAWVADQSRWRSKSVFLPRPEAPGPKPIAHVV